MSTIGQQASAWNIGAEGRARAPAFRVVSNETRQRKRTPPGSLIISPNLDALLEHEERTRARTAEPGTPESSRQSESLASIPETAPIGLPPPPRYSRGPKSPRTPLTGHMRTDSLFSELEATERAVEVPQEKIASPRLPVSSSTSNPYINPAPTLDDVLDDGDRSTGYVSPAEATSVIECPGEESRLAQSRDGSTALPWSPAWTQQSQSNSPSSPQVDNLQRVQFGNSPDAASQNLQVLESENQGGNPSVHGRPGPFVAARAKLVKKKSPKAPDMQQAGLSKTEDGGRDGGGGGNLTWRRRPLISHGPKSSVSSTDSVASSNGPPSTIDHEPRISISSTIYPTSSDHSHSHSLYDPPVRTSFMEIYSPTHPDFSLDSPASTTHDPVSPIYFAGSPVSTVSFSMDTPKPPIPTAPKPLFGRTVLRPRQPSPMPTAMPPPVPSDKQESPLPPTTNLLDTDERAELIKKSRKLARVFGETPGADAMAQQDSGRSASGSRNHAVLALAGDASRPRSAWRATAETLHLTGPRRHSMPLSPDDVSFLSVLSPTFENHQSSRTSKNDKIRKDISSGDLSSNHVMAQLRSDSPTSFIDLSDDEYAKSKVKKTPTRRSHSPTQSITSTMSLEDQAEEDRRRKRERLAKLHRFLGSRVPANLVLGIDDLEASLPAPQGISSEVDDTSRKTWLKRRRSSSAAMFPTFRLDELERVKEELDDKEKAINVRRAHKMEQVFGVAPPQTLFHTRQIPVPPASKPILLPTPVAPIGDISSAPIQQNRSSHTKSKTKKHSRPGTSESAKQLLPKEFGDTTLPASEAARHSFIYNHYQHSLNSLNDILDREDRESLAELHEYLNNADFSTPTPTQKANDEVSTPHDRRLSIASSIKSERRRSLPARTSMISLAPTEFTISTPKAEITAFQQRRRRAAKLTQFFGVNYRELINDVLESIETGVEHEQQNGNLGAEEVEDLLTKLRTLKVKRSLF